MVMWHDISVEGYPKKDGYYLVYEGTWLPVVSFFEHYNNENHFYSSTNAKYWSELNVPRKDI